MRKITMFAMAAGVSLLMLTGECHAVLPGHVAGHIGHSISHARGAIGRSFFTPRTSFFGLNRGFGVGFNPFIPRAPRNVYGVGNGIGYGLNQGFGIGGCGVPAQAAFAADPCATAPTAGMSIRIRTTSGYGR